MAQRVKREFSSTRSRVERDRSTSAPTRYFSTNQEKEVARVVGGSRQLNSGATPFQKGDVSGKDFLIECKTRTKKSDSIAIKKEWLEKLSQEALFMGKPQQALAFNFGPGTKNYYIIEENTFKLLVDLLS